MKTAQPEIECETNQCRINVFSIVCRLQSTPFSPRLSFSLSIALHRFQCGCSVVRRRRWFCSLAHCFDCICSSSNLRKPFDLSKRANSLASIKFNPSTSYCFAFDFSANDWLHLRICRIRTNKNKVNETNHR